MKKVRNILIVISLSILLVPILFYIKYFGANSISNDPADWGPFGDFFGGIINTYISLLTLFVTVYIAYEISKLDERQNTKILDFEKRRFLNELRETGYRRISLELQKVLPAVTKDDGKNDIFNSLMHLRHFTFCNNHLFPFLAEKETTDLIQALTEVHEMIGVATNEEQKEIFSKYISVTKVFLKKMQEFIIEEL